MSYDMEEHRIFRVTGGKASEIIDEYIDKRKTWSDGIQTLLGEYGEIMVTTFGSFAGIRAEKNPDENLFRYQKNHGLYTIRRNCKPGKELRRQVKKLGDQPVSRNYGQRFIIEGNGNVYTPAPSGRGMINDYPIFWGFEPYWFFGIHKNAKVTKLIDGLLEISLSEYYRIAEEHEDLMKKKRKTNG